ncbi:NUDIX hydrolase [Enterococcus sp.]|uniref:NUDIX hydrolase n=1 Tax=Enterococcus sp. TaxID=35783 RepID=UPI003C74BCAE
MGYLLDLRKVVGHQPLVTVGASVILLNEDNQILLIHRRDNGLWGLPAGSTEINEAPVDTAVREVEEETGLRLRRDELALIQVFGGEDFFYTYPNGDQCSNVIISYSARIKTQKLTKITLETNDASWFSPSDIPTTIAKHEKIILKYFLDKNRR